MKNTALKIKNALENYDKQTTVEVKEEERGHRISQTLSDGSAGIMIFIKHDGTMAYNHGWKMDKRYLADVNDYIISVLDKHGIDTSIDCSTLFIYSKNYQKRAI